MTALTPTIATPATATPTTATPSTAWRRLLLMGVLASTPALAIETGTPEVVSLPGHAEVDVDRDGTVSLVEFQAQGGVVAAFRAHDTDDNGRLDRAEYAHLARPDSAASLSAYASLNAYIRDTVITAQIKAMMFEHIDGEGLDVNIETQAGRVALSGWVKSPDQIARAETLAAGVPGVLSVRNDLQVRA